MKPTRAPEMSERTPSSIPTPARRIGQTATFLPEMRGTVVRSSGVEISTSSVASSFVASYVRSRVSSFTSWRKTCVGVSMSRSIPSLCWTSGWSTTVRRSVATFMGQLLAYERVEGVRGNREVPPRHQRRGSVGETWFPPRERAEGERRSCAVRGVAVREGGADDRAHLAEIVLVEAAHGHGRRSEADSRSLHRRALVEGNGVPVHRDLDLVEALLRRPTRPLAPA